MTRRQRSMHLTCLALAMAIAGAAGAQTPVRDIPPAAAKPDFLPGEVIVKLKPGAPGPEQPGFNAAPMEAQAEAQTLSGGEVLFRLPALPADAAPGEAEERTLDAVAAFAARADVEYAQPNYLLQPTLDPNDPRYPEQWHYPMIGLPAAWDVSTGGTSPVVAVIDTGILPQHPDIAGSPNLVPGTDMISNTCVSNDGGGRDSDPTDPGDASTAGECSPLCPARGNSWHGTHVAGTVGVGRSNNNTGVAGVNWTTRVQPVRVLGKCGGSSADIADAIRWAAGLPVPGVATNPTPARVINMSLGARVPCSDTPLQQAAINDAVAQGAVVVVSAGNDRRDASGSQPASCNNVITVAAADRRGHLASRYSNFGATVEIMAPGGDVQRDDDGNGVVDGVLSTVAPQDGGYALYNGTSMAAPHVAGVVALWMSQGLAAGQVLAKLQQTAQPRTPAQCPQPCGAGLLNVGAPPQPIVLPKVSLQPSSLSLRPKLMQGEGTVTALVVENGTPKAGISVAFQSGNGGIATVSPTTAITDASGHATAVVTGVASGDTAITAAIAGSTATTAVQVPLPRAAGVALVALALVLGRARRRRVARAAPVTRP